MKTSKMTPKQWADHQVAVIQKAAVNAEIKKNEMWAQVKAVSSPTAKLDTQMYLTGQQRLLLNGRV